jgi:hypothetical protein
MTVSFCEKCIVQSFLMPFFVSKSNVRMTQGHTIAATLVITTTVEVGAIGVMTIVVVVVVAVVAVVEGTMTGTEIMSATVTVVTAAIVTVATAETGMMTGGINNSQPTFVGISIFLGWISSAKNSR